MSTAKRSADGVGLLYQRYVNGKPHMEALLAEQRANDEIARSIYELRTKARMSQAQLARMIGTTAAVVARLEDADYEGHAFAMLDRIAAALNKRVRIDFVPLPKRRKSA